MDTRILTLDDLDEVQALLHDDQVVALPTETVYGLAGRAASRAAVERIYAAKGRPADNPLIVHAASEAEALALARHVPAYVAPLAHSFWPGPLSLILESAVSWPWVQAGHDTIAVRVPEPDWLRGLIDGVGPLAAPSANRSGRPSPTSAAHCLADLMGRIPAVVDGGPARAGLESTVLDCTAEVPRVLRPGPVTGEMIRAALRGAGLHQPGPAPDPGPGTKRDCDVESAGGGRAAEGRAAGGNLEERGEPEDSVVSPGTRHPHYQPRARVVLLGGSHAEAPDDCMVIGPADGAQSGGTETGSALYRSWHSLEELARNLYAWFREADHAGVSVIYIRPVERRGLGAALMNRLERAAAPRENDH